MGDTRSSYHAWTYGSQPVHKLLKSKGCSIWLQDGKEYFDLTSGGTHFAILGHANEEIRASIMRTFDKYTHFDVKTVAFDELLKLSELVVSNTNFGSDHYRLFLTGCNGADANEAAMRLAFQAHWNKGCTSKKWILGRTQSYHGMSADALSVSDRQNLNPQKVTLSSFRRLIPQHHPIYAKYLGFSDEDYLAKSLSSLKDEISRLGSNNIAAFIGETILGGLIGDVPPLMDYWNSVHAICKEEDIYLIMDEVYCGTGTTGSYHSCDQDDVCPDFLTMGKTFCAGVSPLSALLLRDEIYNLALGSSQRLQFSNTFQGNLMGVAAALSAQSQILAGNFIQEVARKGEYLMDIIRSNLSENPIFCNIRGRGLRISLEFSCEYRNQFAEELHAELMSRRIFNICKWHRLSITPPLIVNDQQIAFLTTNICEAFDLVSKNYNPSPIAYEWLEAPNPTR